MPHNRVKAWLGRYCLPRHSSHSEPSFIELIRPISVYRRGGMPIQSCGQGVSAQCGRRYTEIGLLHPLTWRAISARPCVEALHGLAAARSDGAVWGLRHLDLRDNNVASFADIAAGLAAVVSLRSILLASGSGGGGGGGGRGLHSFPIQLNLSSFVHRITRLSS